MEPEPIPTFPTTHEILDQNTKAATWYDAELKAVPWETRRLLEEYSHVPPDEVLSHIVQMRDRLWTVYPWPCVGQFKFVELALRRHRAYDRIVATLRRGGRYLDVGCAVGQDLRELVRAGCSSDNLFGLEKMRGYVDAGYELWRDRDTLRARFVVADLFDRDNDDAAALLGTVDVAHLGMVLHVWPYAGQVAACERILEFLKPEPGALVVGNSVGRTVATEWPGPEGTSMYKHNVASFEAMWKEVERRTGQRFRVTAWLDPGLGLNGETTHWHDPLTRRLYWEVERL